ncbi:putative F-box domain, galactose oxidase/kelch, beta-propeller, F-box associated interaction [Helianthus anomalus]
MADVYIGDDVLRNILTRLPGKPLLRFRCVSKHWNRVISDPYFMKSRSRRMILLSHTRPLVVIDDNVPTEDEGHSMVRIPSPLLHEKGTHVMIVGTLNGIVVLALHDTSLRCHLILYNPLTCASKILVAMDPPCSYPYILGMDPPSSGYPYVFGFDTDDLKIVRIKFVPGASHMNSSKIFRIKPDKLYEYDVFDLKTSSWSKPQELLQDFYLAGDAGIFLRGWLYWSALFDDGGILALDVKEMFFSKVILPVSHQEYVGLVLGSLDGCLSISYTESDSLNTFHVWMLDEEHSWLKAHSFTFGPEDIPNEFYPFYILGDGSGKIIVRNDSYQLVIYDTSKDSYKTLKGLATVDDSMSIDWINGFNNLVFHMDYPLVYSRPIDYVESLLSPSHMC